MTPLATELRTGRLPPWQTMVDAPVRRCLVASASERRRRLLRAAAEEQKWFAVVVSGSQELLRQAFLERVDLVWIDFPDPGGLQADDRRELRDAAETATSVMSGLLVVSGRDVNGDEEIWARSLGAWAYLPDALGAAELEVVFGDARTALGRMFNEPSGLRDSAWRR